MVIAHKFLRPGAVGPFSGFRWPTPTGKEPGAWVEAVGPPQLCLNGVHACRVAQLPLWIAAELWQIELAEPVHETRQILVSARGRLTKPVRHWNPATAQEFETACAWRAHNRAVATLLDAQREAAATALSDAQTVAEIAELASVGASVLEGPSRHTLEYLIDITQLVGREHTSLVAEITARIAAGSDSDDHDAQVEERRWQADWLANRLDLESV